MEFVSVDLAYNPSRIVSNCAPIASVHITSVGRQAGRDGKRELIVIGVGMFAGLGLSALRRRAATRRLRDAATTRLVRAEAISGARVLQPRMMLLALPCLGLCVFGWTISPAAFDALCMVPAIALAVIAGAEALHTAP